METGARDSWSILRGAEGFAVGGTVHVVINNQVGFTTSRPDDARSTLYCTDPAKIVGAPVLHVNGDDPEAVVFCAQLAFDFRQTFGRDVVIDLVCYRRHGHNEADEPAATQPVMYQNIRAHKTTRELYADALQPRGAIDADGAQGAGRRLPRQARPPATSPPNWPAPVDDPYAVDWKPFLKGKLADAVKTGLARFSLDNLAKKINTLPETLKLHPRVAKIYEDRRKMMAGEHADGLGLRREPRLRDAAHRRLSPAPGRPGFRPRHLLPPPRGAARPGHRRHLHAAAASW